MSKNFKIAVRGGYGYTNFGDDALMKVIHEKLVLLEEPKNIVYFGNQALYLNRIVPGSFIIPFQKISESDLHCKLLLYGGGTQFYQFSGLTITRRLLLKLKRPISLLRTILSRIIAKKSSLGSDKFSINKFADFSGAISVGVGPFESPNSKVEMKTKNLFRSLDFVAIRDVFSEAKCKEWGIAGFNKYSDACFALDLPVEPLKQREYIERVGIIVRDWNHNDEGHSYYDNLLKTSEDLSGQGYVVDFICFAETGDSDWLRILKRRGERIILWRPDLQSVDDFLIVLSNYDLFITARFHGAVFSALLGKPFITVGVEQKLKMISEVFKDSSFCWNYPFSENQCLEQFHLISNNYLHFKDALNAQVRHEVLSANKLFQDLAGFYNKISNDN